MRRVIEVIQSIVESFSEAIRFLFFLFVLLCWLIIGLTWTGSVRLYHYIKRRIGKMPWNFTLHILRFYDKLLTFFKK